MSPLQDEFILAFLFFMFLFTMNYSFIRHFHVSNRIRSYCSDCDRTCIYIYKCKLHALLLLNPLLNGMIKMHMIKPKECSKCFVWKTKCVCVLPIKHAPWKSLRVLDLKLSRLSNCKTFSKKSTKTTFFNNCWIWLSQNFSFNISTILVEWKN